MTKGLKKPYGYVANLNLLQEAAYDGRLQNMTVRIFSLIVTYADQHGACFPSLAKMAGRLGISRQAVQNQIRKLEKLGYIKVFQQKERRTNIYQLNRNNTGCPPSQPHQVDRPATLLGCPKKPLKRLNEETNRPRHLFQETVKQQINYNQEKRHEAATGISKNDEHALADAREQAFQGMTTMEKIDFDLNLQDEAMRLYDSKKDQHRFMKEKYAALYAERYQTEKIEPVQAL